MAISRVHTWSAGEVLLASDLNAEFSNVLNNGSDLVSPFTKAISLGGFALNFDAANTIALTGTTSGVILTGGTIREPTEDTITAFATGGQTNATALSAAKKYHRISVCATAADSVKLPTSTAGQAHYVRNDGAASCQVYGTSPDTINGVATGTGVALAAGTGLWYACTTAGAWTTTTLAVPLTGGTVSGSLSATGGSAPSVSAGNVQMWASGGLPVYSWVDSTQAADGKVWEVITVGGAWKLRTTTDNRSAATDALSIARNGDATFALNINFSAAASKIIPGATSLSLRNNANSADNLLITDAGNATFRGDVLVTGTLAAPITQNSKSAAYTTVLGDAGKHILHPTADNNPRTFTIDSNANVAYVIGTAISFVNQINTVTIAITSDTLTLAGTGATGSRTLAANGIATALKIGTTSWIISGTGLS